MATHPPDEPYRSPRETGFAPPRLVPVRLRLAIAWAVAIAIIGGLACGWIIDQLGELGALSLWGLGVLAGIVSRKITREPAPTAAWCQAAACLLALVVAEVYWIHFNTVQGEDGWLASLSLLPLFVRDYTISAFIALLCAAFGAYSAFWRAGKRYRLVAVVEE